MFRAFCTEPRKPSLLKLGVLCTLSEAGDLRGWMPLVMEGEGTSMLKASRDGTGKDLPALPLPVAERGESPVDDGDMACCVWRRRSLVEDVVGRWWCAATAQHKTCVERQVDV